MTSLHNGPDLSQSHSHSVHSATEAYTAYVFTASSCRWRLSATGPSVACVCVSTCSHSYLLDGVCSILLASDILFTHSHGVKLKAVEGHSGLSRLGFSFFLSFIFFFFSSSSSLCLSVCLSLIHTLSLSLFLLAFLPSFFLLCFLSFFLISSFLSSMP